MSIEELLTVDEVCSILKISDKLLYQLVKDDDLPARKVGREWRFIKSEIMDWIKTRNRVSLDNEFVNDQKRNIENIPNWQDTDVIKFLREISSVGLLIWLYEASDKIKEKIFKAMSHRAVDLCKEDLEVLKSGSKEDVLKLLSGSNSQYMKALIKALDLPSS